VGFFSLALFCYCLGEGNFCCDGMGSRFESLETWKRVPGVGWLGGDTIYDEGVCFWV
jgi:hypothetical protein